MMDPPKPSFCRSIYKNHFFIKRENSIYVIICLSLRSMVILKVIGFKGAIFELLLLSTLYSMDRLVFI